MDAKSFKIYRKVWKVPPESASCLIRISGLRSTVRYGKVALGAPGYGGAREFKIYRKVWKAWPPSAMVVKAR